MDSHQVLFGITAVNLMLVATTWTGSRASVARDDPKVIRAQSIEPVDARGEVRLQLHLGEDGSGNLRIRMATARCGSSWEPRRQGRPGSC